MINEQKEAKQQRLTFEPLENSFVGQQRCEGPPDVKTRSLLLGPHTCALLGTTLSPGFAWWQLHGLFISGFLRKRNLRLAHRSLSQLIELFVN